MTSASEKMSTEATVIANTGPEAALEKLSRVLGLDMEFLLHYAQCDKCWIDPGFEFSYHYCQDQPIPYEEWSEADKLFFETYRPLIEHQLKTAVVNVIGRTADEVKYAILEVAKGA